jgi:3-methyladenine DNA glycosylase AlkD
MKKEVKEIQDLLISCAGKDYQAFFTKMVPGTQLIYGVKTPVLNTIARQYREGSFDLAEALWNAGALEEKIIAVKIMEKKGKDDPARLLRLFKQFSNTIDNWAVCDGLGMQFLRSIVTTHQKDIFSIAARFNKSSNFWQRRLSLVMVEWYTRHSHARNDIKKLVHHLENDKEYYVKKAVVWINKNFKKGK